jgi:hypothetical protein
MKNKIQILLALFALWAFTNCSGFKVISDSDPTEDFTKLKKFEFAGWGNESGQSLNRFERERIEAAFANEAELRGLELVNSGGDAIAVLYVLKNIRTEKVANTTTTGMGGMGMGGMGMGRAGMMGPGWGWGGHMSNSQTRISEQQYLEGTLILEVYDTKRKNLVWMAAGTNPNVSEDPKKRQRSLPKEVKYIMKGYPVKPLK